MSSFRYSYTAMMRSGDTEDANGNPIEGYPVMFECDYQPTTTDTSIKFGGSVVQTAYKLFTPPALSGYLPLQAENGAFIITQDGMFINIGDTQIAFLIGTEIVCNNTKGVICAIYPTKLNTEIWVK